MHRIIVAKQLVSIAKSLLAASVKVKWITSDDADYKKYDKTGPPRGTTSVLGVAIAGDGTVFKTSRLDAAAGRKLDSAKQWYEREIVDIVDAYQSGSDKWQKLLKAKVVWKTGPSYTVPVRL